MFKNGKLRLCMILLAAISIMNFSGCTTITSRRGTRENTGLKTDIEIQRKLEEWTEKLYSPDPTVRSSAAVFLLGLNHPQAQEPLIRILRHNKEREDVQISIIRAFGFTRDERATGILISLLDHESTAVREAAEEALGRLNTSNAIRRMSESLLDTSQSLNVRMLLAKILGNTNDRDAVDPLIKILDADNRELRETAMKSLVKITKETGTNDPAWWKQWWSRNKAKPRDQWLEDILSKQDVSMQELKQKIDQLKLEVAQKAIRLLETRPDKTDPKPLIDALQSEHSSVRIFAVKELVKIKDPSVIGALSNAVTDKEEEVRIEVVQALGDIDDRKSIESLLYSLNDENLIVREKAARSLGKLGKAEARDALILALHNNTHVPIIGAIIDALGQIGNLRSVEPLVVYLTHKEPKIREITAAALGKIRDARAVEPLIAALSDEHERVRWFAADSLGKIGDPASVESLIKLLTDSSPRVRESAVTALGQIGNRQSIESLITVLQDVDKRVAEQAAESILNIKKMDFEIMNTIASAFLAHKDYRRAEIVLERLIAEHATQPELKEEILQAKIKLARTLVAANNLRKAIAIYEELVKQVPADDAMKSQLIQYLKETKQYDRALEWYAVWIKESPHNNKQQYWQGRVEIANTLFGQGKYEQVKNIIARLQAEDPGLGGNEFQQNFERLAELSMEELSNSKQPE
ncbi:MAG: HEAT repeat domain-containing protein [Candidatus Loosdrechtia sp.]|uniref:HEAT repeat domain-containing protein n=1 Tax=Candidatus Loosdrechtia sp. TaxID=3101272 RepID=UPI003A737444|nr:MAG: HEAT repeat domain-containing protein [Candidatus Jettenia sp. AMX2]